MKRFHPVLGLALALGSASAFLQEEQLAGAPAPLEQKAKPFTNSVKMKFAPIPAGRFTMGSPRGEKGRNPDEAPHEVEITRPFHLGVYEVTQEQYRAVMGANPSHFSPVGRGSDAVAGRDTTSFPVEQTSWHDAAAFCVRLSALPAEKEARRRYRLPSEAEWEYACRAGTSTPFSRGRSLSSTAANFIGERPYGKAALGPYLKRTAAAGSYGKGNAWGLFDMHGNAWEWCADWYGEDYYKSSPKRDPRGPARGKERVVRGGGWGSAGQTCRSACRGQTTPGTRTYAIGFRVACTTPR
jgi:formylglycine-generating enzyme required for sulfatase activity